MWELLGSNSPLGTSSEGKEPGLAWSPAPGSGDAPWLSSGSEASHNSRFRLDFNLNAASSLQRAGAAGRIPDFFDFNWLSGKHPERTSF
ncbi:hypothetical protein EYF80_052883 [Liparis tanakae]|uniref:Uncharacterized protein n=1 Tax=Liparis tanakae TaxID=230148 RepID=A0A4Z2F808_9TELE|nr:hypothetical protein EYF80_052883 [Liparis tanakae]